MDFVLRMFTRWLALPAILISTTAIADVDTSGTIEPSRPFTLLIIDSPRADFGNFGRVPDALQQSPVAQWLAYPQTAQLRRWLSMANVKRLEASSPIVREHHADILRDAESLPAIALVDSSGGRWCLFSGSSLPSSEYELARSLDVYYAAVMQAAKEVGVNAIHTITPQRLNQIRNQQVGRGPKPYSPQNGGLFNPTIRPNVNVPEGGFDLNTRATVDPLTLAVIGGSVLVLSIVFLVAVAIFCFAITNKPRKKK